MNAIEDLRSCLDLVAKDLCEAHAADRMLYDMMIRQDRLAEFSRSEVRFGLRFIEHALALRMMLAVHRTLQGASGDKASFARVLSLVRTAGQGVNVSGIEKRFNELRDGEAAGKLRECRNGFMAHTLVGEPGSRDGMNLRPVSDLLDELTRLYEGIRRIVTGVGDRVISEGLEKWRARAHETWDALLGTEDADEDLLAWSLRSAVHGQRLPPGNGTPIYEPFRSYLFCWTGSTTQPKRHEKPLTKVDGRP